MPSAKERGSELQKVPWEGAGCGDCTPTGFPGHSDLVSAHSGTCCVLQPATTSEPQFTHGWKGAAVALSAKVVRAGPGLCLHLVWGGAGGKGSGREERGRGGGSTE